jgi:hypothetical protein
MILYLPIMSPTTDKITMMITEWSNFKTRFFYKKNYHVHKKTHNLYTFIFDNHLLKENGQIIFLSILAYPTQRPFWSIAMTLRYVIRCVLMVTWWSLTCHILIISDNVLNLVFHFLLRIETSSVISDRQ